MINVIPRTLIVHNSKFDFSDIFGRAQEIRIIEVRLIDPQLYIFTDKQRNKANTHRLNIYKHNYTRNSWMAVNAEKMASSFVQGPCFRAVP